MSDKSDTDRDELSLDQTSSDTEAESRPSNQIHVKIRMEDDVDADNIGGLINNFVDSNPRKEKVKRAQANARIFYDRSDSDTDSSRDHSHAHSHGIRDERDESDTYDYVDDDGDVGDDDVDDVDDDDDDDESIESADLIDLSPGESVSRITNQLISERDDDVERMNRHRTIARIAELDCRRIKTSKGLKISKVPKLKVRYPHGYLKVVCGSMYSGKSSHLRTDKNDWSSLSGIGILVINYIKDKRYTSDDMVMTHNHESVKCVSVEHLAEITNGDCYDQRGSVILPQNYDLILIDEAQFYDDLRDNVVHWVDILHKTVFAYGLDGNFRRQPFGQIPDLISIADEYIKKKANCMMCNNGTEALFTWRLEDNDDNTDIVKIGGDTVYIALCRKHYNRVNPPKVVITGQMYSVSN